MGAPPGQGRWTVAVAGTALMACLGTVYAWSLFAQPLAAAFGWSSTTTTGAFALSILSLGAGAALGGRWQDRAGPRPVALAGALLWACGNLLAGLGTARLGAPWLYATYGLLGGLGLGLAYVTPVATVTKWFPGRRGLGSGMVVMGFGLGAFLYSSALKSLPGYVRLGREAAEALAARAAGGAAALAPAQVETLQRIFVASGLVFALAGCAAAALLVDPPAGPAAPAAASGASDFSPREALATPQFWALWAMLFLDVTAGILFISNAVPILRELTGAAPATAAAAYGVLALFNAAGRLLWGAVSDRLGRRAAFFLVFATQVAAFLAVGRVHDLWLASALFAVVLLGYGGGFGTMPSYAADFFGTRHLGAIYGFILLAWGAAGVAGPVFVAWVKDHTGSYAGALPVVAAVLAAAAVLPLVARRPAPPAARPAPPGRAL